MRLGVLIVAVGALLLSACANSDKDDGVDKGYCTEATVDAYNNINRYLFGVDKEKKTQSCRTLKELLKGRSCKAQSLMTGQEKTISYEDVSTTCEPKNDTSASASEPIKITSKYVDASGFCTKEYDKALKEITFYLNESLTNKSKIFSDIAINKCQLIGVEFYGRTCVSYDSKKKVAVTNSETQGKLGKLCDGAKKLSKRFEK